MRFSVFWKISDYLDGSLVECFHSINGGPRCVLRLVAEYSGKKLLTPKYSMGNFLYYVSIFFNYGLRQFGPFYWSMLLIASRKEFLGVGTRPPKEREGVDKVF